MKNIDQKPVKTFAKNMLNKNWILTTNYKRIGWFQNCSSVSNVSVLVSISFDYHFLQYRRAHTYYNHKCPFLQFFIFLSIFRNRSLCFEKCVFNKLLKAKKCCWYVFLVNNNNYFFITIHFTQSHWSKVVEMIWYNTILYDTIGYNTVQ